MAYNHYHAKIKVRMVKGIPSVDFNPHDDLILDLLKGTWPIMLDNGLDRFGEIYFSQKIPSSTK